MTSTTIALSNGVEMPALGLGVFQTPPEVAIDLLLLHQPLGSQFNRTLDAYRALERRTGQ